MKFNRSAFTRSILRHFLFLASEYKLRRISRIYAYEFVDRYTDHDVTFSIFVAHPELPYITFSRKTDPVKEYYYSQRGKRTAASLMRGYYRPVGPQVDKVNHQYLPGGGQQVQMLVPGPNRMNFLRVAGVRPI